MGRVGRRERGSAPHLGALLGFDDEAYAARTYADQIERVRWISREAGVASFRSRIPPASSEPPKRLASQIELFEAHEAGHFDILDTG